MNDVSIWQAVVLGIVEGLTEFLPVSSTGHLKIAEGLMGLDVTDDGVVGFTAVIQVGAIAAVLVHFARDIGRLVRAWTTGLVRPGARGDRDYRFAWWVVWATVPIVVVGLLAAPLVEGPLASLWVVVASLVAGSAVLWGADRRGSRTRGEDQVTLADSMLVGGSQILALLLPGFSRSGATISTGLVLGLDRLAATRLSFFLSIPALTGAGLYELKSATSGSTGATALVVGTAVSFLVAYAAIAWLLRFVTRHDFTGFIGYRLVLAVALTVLIITGVVSA